MTQIAEPQRTRGEAPAPARVHHWIGGRLVEGTSGRRGPVYNPATGAVAREVDFASAEEVDAAVRAASGAAPGWRATSLSKRTDILFRIRNVAGAVGRYPLGPADVLVVQATVSFHERSGWHA